MSILLRRLAQLFPHLSLKLRQASLPDTEEEYLKRVLATSVFLSFGFLFVVFLFYPNFLLFLCVPFILPFFFLYFVKYVDVKIEHIKASINQEIVFAGRFLIIELESGVPMYDTFANLAKNYKIVGTYFAEIVEKVDLGTSLEDSINEAIIATPSPNLRKMLWQVLNSIKTGSDVSKSLDVVIEQIVREQQIQVKEYGRKLNPLAMFYMMVAIIMPSLGTTMLVVVATFIGLKLSIGILLFIAGIIGFVQFMFLSVIKTIRPPMEF